MRLTRQKGKFEGARLTIMREAITLGGWVTNLSYCAYENGRAELTSDYGVETSILIRKHLAQPHVMVGFLRK